MAVAFNQISRTVRAAVIDNVNPINFWANLTDHVEDVLADLEAWNHNCNILACITHVVSDNAHCFLRKVSLRLTLQLSWRSWI